MFNNGSSETRPLVHNEQKTNRVELLPSPPLPRHCYCGLNIAGIVDTHNWLKHHLEKFTENAHTILSASLSPSLSLLFMHTFVFLVLVIPRFGQTVCSFCITTDTNANRDTYNARGPKERERKRGRRNKRIHLSNTALAYPVTRRAKATCILHDQVTPSLTPPNTPHSPRDLKYTHTKNNK